VDGALAKEADRVFEQVLGGEATEAEVSATLIRLARLEGTAGPTRRVALRREFPDGRWALLQTLADVKGNRLVLIGGRQSDRATDPGIGRETAEIAHEALLTRWPRLHALLSEAPEDKRTLDRLADRATEWADVGATEAKDKLLARTDAEREAFDALARARPLWLSDEERDFVEASVADYEARRERERTQAAERERLLREAIANESRALAALSEAASLQGRHTDALKLAVASWPRRGEDLRPMLERSLHAMGLATEGRIEAGPPLRREAFVRSAAFSPDGTRVVTASNTARLWDAATGAPLGEPLRHESRVRSAAFSPDGARVVTASEDGTARLWDAVTGAPLGEPMRHNKAVNTAAFSPDGARVVTASNDGTARLWDAATGAPLGEPMRHDTEVNTAAFSPRDGARVVTASSDGTARLWDGATGAPLGEPLRHEATVRSRLLPRRGAGGHRLGRPHGAAVGHCHRRPARGADAT
jgi:hypothetical protein